MTYAKLAFVGWVLTIGVGLLVAWAGAHQERVDWDSLRTQFNDHSLNTQNHHVYLPLVAGYLPTLIEIFVYLGILTWQFRAAKTARGLFLPAKHSPALGAWSWIIPVVNFWFPYQSIRDCLPPDDPGRVAVVRMWTCFVGMTVTYITAVVLITVGLVEGAVVGATALALSVGFASMGIKSVEAISDAHSRLLLPQA